MNHLEAIEHETRALKLALLSRMGELTKDSTYEQVRRCRGFLRRYLETVDGLARAYNDVDIFQDVSKAIRADLYCDPSFKNFRRQNTRIWKARPEYKNEQKSYHKTYFQTVLKARRNTPEYREQQAQAARQRRARRAVQQ